jgi:hypothetical protein
LANRERGEASIVIEGVSYTLSIDTNALCEIETLFSSDGPDVLFHDVLRRAASGRLAPCRGVLWGLLRRYHPDVSLLDAGCLLGVIGTVELGRHLSRLIPHAIPDRADVNALLDATAGGKTAAAARPERRSGWDWPTLQRFACRVGIRSDEFWRLTLRDLFRQFAVSAQRTREEYDQRVGQAWLTALLVMKGVHDPKKFPPLDKLLKLRSRIQTPAQQRANLMAIATAFNLKVRHGTQKRKTPSTLEDGRKG